MKELEQFLFQTYYDQGGECSFIDWLRYTAEDDSEFGHSEAKEYISHLSKMVESFNKS